MATQPPCFPVATPFLVRAVLQIRRLHNTASILQIRDPPGAP